VAGPAGPDPDLHAGAGGQARDSWPSATLTPRREERWETLQGRLLLCGRQPDWGIEAERIDMLPKRSATKA
jgi:hypothetical protein